MIGRREFLLHCLQFAAKAGGLGLHFQPGFVECGVVRLEKQVARLLEEVVRADEVPDVGAVEMPPALVITLRRDFTRSE